jgi:hypothetical protein
VVVDFTEPTTQASASDSGCEACDYDVTIPVAARWSA